MMLKITVISVLFFLFHSIGNATTQENTSMILKLEKKVSILSQKVRTLEEIVNNRKDDSKIIKTPEIVTNEDNHQDEYNQAYNALIKNNVQTAQQKLNEFVKKYPKSNLIAKAHFFLGNIYFDNEDYRSSAINYLKSYKSSKSIPKAPKSLLGLGMSLLNLNKTKVACTTFKKLTKEFSKPHSVIKEAMKYKLDNNCK